MTETNGLYDKYEVIKTDGTPIDPHAIYFVLRLDTDPTARLALREYAKQTPNLELGADLLRYLDIIEVAITSV